jgi:hypothetical protein
LLCFLPQFSKHIKNTPKRDGSRACRAEKVRNQHQDTHKKHASNASFSPQVRGDNHLKQSRLTTQIKVSAVIGVKSNLDSFLWPLSFMYRDKIHSKLTPQPRSEDCTARTQQILSQPVQTTRNFGIGDTHLVASSHIVHSGIDPFEKNRTFQDLRWRCKVFSLPDLITIGLFKEQIISKTSTPATAPQCATACQPTIRTEYLQYTRFGIC